MKSTAVLASALGGVACAHVNVHADQAGGTLQPAAIYQRVTNEFAQADFYKPADPETNDLAFTLAPLLLQEVSGAKEPPPRPDRFGTLCLSHGVPVIDNSRPAVYWQADAVRLDGKVHARFTYLWRYAPAVGESNRGADPRSANAETSDSGRLSPARHPGDAFTGKPVVRPAGLPSQGIRITLSSAGQPVIWEALADNSGAELIFVSEKLEAAAAAQFGKVLPGRRYAIERRPEEAPHVVVARVIEDGPVAMGPIVYLSAGTRTVSTLICRCMPAQVKTLLATTTYKLLPFQPMAADSLIPQATAPSNQPAALWPGGESSGNSLEQCLRLPAF